MVFRLAETTIGCLKKNTKQFFFKYLIDNDRNIFQQLLCTAVPLRRTNIGGFFVDWKLMQCKSIHVLSGRHNVPTSGRSTVIKNRFLINKNHQQLLGSQSKFLKWIKRVQMCNGANYSTVHRHDLVEQTIWIWRYHRWHCHMSHNLFWAHEFPFFSKCLEVVFVVKTRVPDAWILGNCMKAILDNTWQYSEVLQLWATVS